MEIRANELEDIINYLQRITALSIVLSQAVESVKGGGIPNLELVIDLITDAAREAEMIIQSVMKK